MVMRTTKSPAARQSGMAMVTVMVMLVAISLLGVVVMNMGSLEQKMAGNFMLLQESFDATEGGVSATVSLDGDTDDPFGGPAAVNLPGTPYLDDWCPGWPRVGDPPIWCAELGTLTRISTMTGVDANLNLVAVAEECPRAESATGVKFSACDYYHVDADHQQANTGVGYAVTQHVVNEVAKQ